MTKLILTMKFPRALFVAFAMYSMECALSQNATYYYPDWDGGTNTCLSDGNNPYYMELGNYMKTTLEECCDYYYSWNPTCIEDGGGTPPVGSLQWYVDYKNHKCVQDCPVNGASCGGLAMAYKTLFADETKCCEEKLRYISVGLCTANSRGNGTYAGSNQWYVDYENNKCVQDCDSATPGCGGIIEHPGTTLYADALACCAAKLSYIDVDLCASNSDPTSTGTGKFYVDFQNSVCLEDSDTGIRTNASVVLYDTLPECCSRALSWVNSAFCESRSNGTGYSSQWFVNYENEVCVQDCDPADGTPCSALNDSSATLYATALDCCQERLSWIDSSNCDTLSQGGNITGTLKWYVDYGNQMCVQDCPADGASCGGLAALFEMLYDDETACCEEKLSYISAGLCQAKSLANGTYAGTNQWYVDYESNKCVQDCDMATPGCGGIIEDAGTTLYADAASCCTAKLSYIDADLCASNSDPTSTGTGKFYVDFQNSVCLEDSDTGVRTNASIVLYDTLPECCTRALSWVDSAVCESRSNGTGYTNNWFVDYRNEVCVQDCDPAGGAPCVALNDSSTTLYTTPLECCEAKLGWIDSATCDTLSQVLNLTGSGEYYVDWSLNKCVRDCLGKAPCGGLAASWEPRYATSALCCAELAWIDPDQCVLAQNWVYGCILLFKKGQQIRMNEIMSR